MDSNHRVVSIGIFRRMLPVHNAFMQIPGHLTSKEFRIEVVRHKSGLLFETSPDLPGFVHTARTEEQFEAEIGDTIKEMLEAAGHRVMHIENIDHLNRSPWITKRFLRTTVEVEAA